MPEGSIFKPTDINGTRLPVMVLEGCYYDFCEYETPLLGFICQESNVATRAAYAKQAANEKTVIAFGIRRLHPGIAPAIDRTSYIGGMDGVSSIIGAETIGQTAMGIMPHSLIIIFQDQKKTWKAFDEIISTEIPRIALADTYSDEKAASIMESAQL